MPHGDAHYQGDLMPFDVWDTWPLDDYRKQAVKYIARAAKKGQWRDDLLKARDYLLLLCERGVAWRVINRDYEASLEPRLRFWAIVSAWGLCPRRAEALGAMLFARSSIDLKVAATHCEIAAERTAPDA